MKECLKVMSAVDFRAAGRCAGIVYARLWTDPTALAMPVMGLIGSVTPNRSDSVYLLAMSSIRLQINTCLELTSSLSTSSLDSTPNS